MQAIILMAGESSRMMPLSKTRHKSMIKLFGKPIAEHTVDSIKQSGITDFVFVLGQHGQMVQDYFGDGSAFGIKIDYVHQIEPKGQYDALLTAERFIRGDFLVSNPNYPLLGNMFEKIVSKFHSESVFSLIPIVYEENIWEYGEVEVDENLNVLSVIEKPEKGKEKSHLRRTMVDVVQKEWLEYMKKALYHPFPNIEAFNLAIADGKHVKAIRMDDNLFVPSIKYTWDLLMMRDYMAEKLFGSVDLNYIDQTSILDGSSIVVGSDVGRDVRIGKNCKIINSILMDGVVVGDDCVIEDSIVGWDQKIDAVTQILAEVADDGKNIFREVKGKMVDSGRKKLGVTIG